MTDKPTPKEIDDLVYELRQAGKDDTYSLASAVLAKWGQPSGATEEVENLRKALVYAAFALHGTPQYMLAQGLTLIDGDTVRVSRDGWTVEASVNPHRQPAPATQQGVAYAALPDEGEPWRGHKFKEVQRGYWRCECGKTVKETTADWLDMSADELRNLRTETAALCADYDADRAARAPADSVLEDAAREAIEKVLALFPFNVPIQKFTVNNGPCLTADNDDEFYSVKRVLAFLTEIKTTLDAARKQGASHDR